MAWRVLRLFWGVGGGVGGGGGGERDDDTFGSRQRYTYTHVVQCIFSIKVNIPG